MKKPLFLVFLLTFSLISIGSMSAVNATSIQSDTDISVDNNHDDKIPVDLGKPVTVDPNSSVMLETQSGIMLNLSVNESLEVTFDEFDANPNATLPDDLVSIENFVHVKTNNSDANFNASFSLPFDDTQLPYGVDEAKLNLTFFNGTSNMWEQIPSEANVTSDVVTAETDHFSTWTLTQANVSTPRPEPGVPFEIEQGKPVEVVPGEGVSLVTPSGIMVNVTVGESVEITMVEDTESPVGNVPVDKVALDTYITIETNETADVNATIKMPVPENLPNGVTPDELEVAFYNETSESWETVPAWSENGYIHANTTHFSTWTLFAPEGDENESLLPFSTWITILSGIVAIPLLRNKFKH